MIRSRCRRSRRPKPRRCGSRGLAGLTAQTSEIMEGLSAGQVPQAAFRLPITYWLGSAHAEPPPPDPVPSEEAIERVRRIDDTFGVLSLCTTADNLLLWAHYAAEHRGPVHG